MGAHVDTSELIGLERDLVAGGAKVEQESRPMVAETLREVQADARAFAPKRTGALAASITVDMDESGLGGDVGPTVSYAPEVEYGAEPHLIRAHDGGSLVFAGPDGELVFPEVVHHPGNAPQPFLGPAFDRRAPQLEDRAGDIGERFL